MAAKQNSITPRGRAGGIRAGIALLRRLERDEALADSCDPGWDKSSTVRPMRNVVYECLNALRHDAEAVEGLCLTLSGYLGIVAAGVVPDARYMGEQMRQRLAWERAGEAARRDDAFQAMLTTVTAGAS